jgi:hypothetical protein
MLEFSPRELSRLVEFTSDYGLKVPSVRGDTVEIEDFLFKIENPLDRIATERWRKMNLGFAITDSLSFLVGDNLLAPLVQFVPNFSRFSTNGRTIDGSYGNRIHTSQQLDLTIEMLKKDPHTRRAVISIYMGAIDLLGGGGLNTPCTLNFHFLVRDGRLNMKVMMRSNDVILGLTNDVFTFTFLQEYISVKTGIPMGAYVHYASSFHLYETDLERIGVIEVEPVWPHVMNKMPSTFEPHEVYRAICNISKFTPEECLKHTFKTEYETNLYFTAAATFHRHKHGAKALYEMVADDTLQKVLNYWIKKEEHA